MADKPIPEEAQVPEETGDSAKSTVRKRKRNPMSSTQRFLPIGEIRNDTVILKNGGLRAVLKVQAINFNLKSETEQQGIIAGYEAFLNTLSFPIQIVVRSTKMNIDPYITRLRVLTQEQKNPLLRRQTEAYANFVEKIVDIADIMQKRFLVVIPLDDEVRKKSALSQLFSWLGIDDTPLKAGQRNRQFSEKSNKLRERLNLVETGLHNIGLATKRLATYDLIELYYHIYNPETSQEQKLPGMIDMNTAKMVL